MTAETGVPQDLPVILFIYKVVWGSETTPQRICRISSLDNSPIHQDPRKALQRKLLTGGYRRQKQHTAVYLTTCRRPPRYSTTPLQRCCVNGEDKSWTFWWKVHAVMFREKHHIPQNSTAECQAGKTQTTISNSTITQNARLYNYITETGKKSFFWRPR